MRGVALLARRRAIGFQDGVNEPHSGPITGRSRSTGLRSGGSALASACRTIRRCTLSFAATPLMVPTPNSYSLRICSNSSTFALLSIPDLLPHWQDAPARGGWAIFQYRSGPIYGIEIR